MKIQAPLVTGLSVEARGMHEELKAAGGARPVASLRAGRGAEEKGLLVDELAGKGLAERCGNGLVGLTDLGLRAWVTASRERWARS